MDTPAELMQTHYDGCWRNPRHHACAVARLEGNERAVGELAAQSTGTRQQGSSLDEPVEQDVST